MTAIAIAVYLAVFNVAEPAQDYVAVFNNEQPQPLWLVAADMETGAVTFRSFNQTAQQVDQAFELWMLPANNLLPMSLGLLPVSGTEVQITIPSGLMAMLQNATGLAISLEPSGGSPTGVPTGPVLYQTQIHTL